MDPTGLFGPLLGLAEKIVSAIFSRQRVVLRVGSASGILLATLDDYGRGNTLYHHDGQIFVYNGGPGRITVHAVGWIAWDGTRGEASSREALERSNRGGPELKATASASTLVQAEDQHGGLADMFVELAGSEKPRRRKLPPEWIGKVRALAVRSATMPDTRV